MLLQKAILIVVGALFLNGCATEKKPRACCQPANSNAPSNPATFDSNALVLETPGEWQDDAGRHLKLSELGGQTVLLSMFYASCEGICVITRNDMLAVETSLTPAAREHTTFVLVTLAPGLDTPAVLKTYRKENGLSAGHWRLLRGSAESTAALAARLGIGYGKDRAGLFRHASELTVIGAAGNILLQQDGIHADLAETVRVINSTASKEPLTARADKS